MNINDRNYYNDPRVCDAAEQPTIIVENDDGTIDTVPMPWKWGVCGVCDGEGKHVNPSLDAGGLCDEFADDEDFMDDYMGGAYDVPCNRCKGRRVVPVVNEYACDPETVREYKRQRKQAALSRQEEAMERAMGA